MVLQLSVITPDTRKAAAAVLELLEPLFGRGHMLWIDNFFNSPELARKLKIEHSTDCIGTLKLNRKNVPTEVKDKKLEKGEIIARHSGPVTVLKWPDKRNVTMVSTYHNADTHRVSNKGKETQTPLCVTDYNHNMGGVDLKNQLLHMYMVKRKKMTKWYLKLFKRLLNSTVLNSFVVYQQVTGKNIQQLLDRIQLVEGLFMKYARAVETRSVPGRQASDNTIQQLTESQFLRKVAPKTEKSKPQRRCVVCSKHGKKKTSVYCCQICDVGLFLEDCCELYHTKLNY